MNNSTYMRVSGIVFLIVALVHLWRAVTSTSLILGATSIPVWVSWVGVVVAGFLAYSAFKK